MSKHTYQLVERMIIGAMILGIIGMFQPWRIELYTWGFHLLLFGTLAFTVFSHFSPREDEDEEKPASVGVTEG
jgi:hypothetical protein